MRRLLTAGRAPTSPIRSAKCNFKSRRGPHVHEDDTERCARSGDGCDRFFGHGFRRSSSRSHSRATDRVPERQGGLRQDGDAGRRPRADLQRELVSRLPSRAGRGCGERRGRRHHRAARDSLRHVFPGWTPIRPARERRRFADAGSRHRRGGALSHCRRNRSDAVLPEPGVRSRDRAGRRQRHDGAPLDPALRAGAGGCGPRQHAGRALHVREHPLS